MQNNTVARIDGQPVMSVNPELERELPPLDDSRMTYLRIAIKRDGILDAVKYWVNPETGLNEIIDGHHRHKIAQELGIMYAVKEVDFTGRTITAVKYWMHVNQSGRRGSEVNTARMIELKEMLAAESKEHKTKTQIVKEVATDAKKSERQVWRSVNEQKPLTKPTLTKKQRLARYRKLVLEGIDLNLDDFNNSLRFPDWLDLLQSIDAYKG